MLMIWSIVNSTEGFFNQPLTEEGWSGTILPARMAGVVQRQADWNFPLRLEDAQELLRFWTR